MHFYPIPMRLVEIMRGSQISDAVIQAARSFIRSLGLVPIVLRRDSVGFVANRIWRVIKKECLKIVAEGVATAADVDRAWILNWGTRFGPFGLMDIVGVDVVRDIELSYWRVSGDSTDRPPSFLDGMIDRGELGVKTGRGFYSYPNPAYQHTGWLEAIDSENNAEGES